MVDIDYNLEAKKSLGQNFIFDQNILNGLAQIALAQTDKENVLEIGPGPGGLTIALLGNGAKHLTSLEKDARCVQHLKEISTQYPHFLPIEGDALAFDESQMPDGLVLVGNLPYNISTVLLVKWLYLIERFSKLSLMFQLEVAQRITATVGSKDYGRLAILCQYLADCRIEKVLPPTVFYPHPKVYSAFVTLCPKKGKKYPCSLSVLDRLVSKAFSMRRKMVKTSLKKIPDIDMILESLGISPNLRPEDISVDDFCRIAQKMEGK